MASCSMFPFVLKEKHHTQNRMFSSLFPSCCQSYMRHKTASLFRLKHTWLHGRSACCDKLVVPSMSVICMALSCTQCAKADTRTCHRVQTDTYTHNAYLQGCAPSVPTYSNGHEGPLDRCLLFWIPTLLLVNPSKHASNPEAWKSLLSD